MDLLTREDVERNDQVIVPGYGLEYEGDKQNFEKTLKFVTMHIVRMEDMDLNMTIQFSEQYKKICAGRSSWNSID